MTTTIKKRAILFIFTTLVAVSSFGHSAYAANERQRPNILFIYADDQSYKSISSYGSGPEWAKTPHIDAVARRGVRFHRAYFGAWCMPSRASMLTGRLQHGVESMRMADPYPSSTYDPAACPFIPAQFREQGYHTAQIGKWHTGTDTGYGRDWDYQVVWNRPKYPNNAGNYYDNQMLTINGETQTVVGYSTDRYTDWAVDYIAGANRDPQKPWYLWLCYGAVHGPTTPAKRHFGKLAGNPATTPANILGPWPDKPKFLENTRAWMRAENGTIAMRNISKAKGNFDALEAGKSYDAWVQQYNECNMAVDEGVGRVMQALKDSGQLDNTLVVYTADQGYALGEHGLNQKVAAYDAAISSPLIISYPGHAASGETCPHPINAPDLMDYLCRMAGVDIPWQTHGRDIRPLLQAPTTTKWDQSMLMTHTAQTYGSDTNEIPTDQRLTVSSNVPWYVLLRSGQLKYIRTLVEGETEELYDLASDPEELKNLANDPTHEETLKSLRAKAVAELKKTGAGFATKMPVTRQMSEGM